MKSTICTLFLSVVASAYSLFAQPSLNKGNDDYGPATKPFIEKFIELPGNVKLAYVEQGDAAGVPVIFLHGLTDSWHSFESVLPFLPKTLHVFAITLRGHGNSFKPGKGYHPKDFAADIAEFIKAGNLMPVVIAGHSMGGVVAQQFALDYPQLTRALVTIDSDASFSNNPVLQEFLKEVQHLTDPVGYEYADAFQRSTTFRPIDKDYYMLLVGESLKVPAHVWKEATEGMMSVDYSAKLKKFRKPALIFWGEQDLYCSKADQEQLASALENSRLQVYAETGHALHWEQPQRFAASLIAFISTLINESASPAIGSIHLLTTSSL